MSPSSAQTQWTIGYRTKYRAYNYIPDGVKTDWHTLEKGGYYFIEYKHIQATSYSHATISLEIEDPNQPVDNHYHSMRQVQRVIVG